MSVAELKKLVPPPANPVEAGPANGWKAIEERLNVKLPDDYKDFGLAYGTGRFCRGFLEIYNPFSKSYEAIVDAEARFLKGVKEAGMDLPYDVYPAEPGLFPLGRDENGHSIYWLMKNPSNSFQIVLRRHENVYETYSLTLTTFLARALANRIRPIIWPDPFRADELVFEPIKPKNSPKPKKRRK